MYPPSSDLPVPSTDTPARTGPQRPVLLYLQVMSKWNKLVGWVETLYALGLMLGLAASLVVGVVALVLWFSPYGP